MDTIEIINDQMGVMDEDGNVLDACVLSGYRQAKQQIQRWTDRYSINVADAYRRLADHFSQR